MLKTLLTLTIIGAFAVGSAVAGSCGGCKDKDSDKKKDKESYLIQVKI